MKKVRCAIYTRKSSEEGLEQEFNSLHAQREACAAYIASQKHEGWVLLPDLYDDGGISGGTLERPAVKRLLEDVDAGKVDQIVVYKVDRLTRSLADFAKLVDRLDAAGASFVSVTQSFNTATSMGRLTLNVLLSFAQFEREVTAERIRDKIAASKKKGLWMGGTVPFGYVADGRTLKINEKEAVTVRTLYDLYLELGTIRAVGEATERQGLCSRRRIARTGRITGGKPFGRGHIHCILSNPLYAGMIRHKRVVHEGQHRAIIDPEIWDDVQRRLRAQSARTREKETTGKISAFAGKLFDETCDRLTPSHSNKKGRRYRYYVSNRLVKHSGEKISDGWRLPAKQLEDAIINIVARALTDAGMAGRLVAEQTAAESGRLHEKLTVVGKNLSEADATQLAADLITRVEIAPGHLTVSLNPHAIALSLGVDPDRLNVEALELGAPFQFRKRGVETRLVFGDEARDVDQVLVRNIAKAYLWFEAIKQGRTFNEIARDEGTSDPRIRQMIGLAFLAPDIVRSALAGTQPLGLTSEWLQRHDLPTGWNEQRRLIATL